MTLFFTLVVLILLAGLVFLARRRRYDYNLAVIGGGAAGLVSAYIAAAVRARVILIEKGRMGGDCLNTGCVPSKALLRSAQVLQLARRGEEFGLRTGEPTADFAAVMARVQRVIARVAPHDSAERYRGLGVEVTQGQARLLDAHTLDIDGRRISARKVIVATGARPVLPPIPGIETVQPLTSDTVWELRERPQRLLVLGGGPIGCELAQAFQRLGCAVTLVQRGPRLLPREDAEIGQHIAARLGDEGIQVLTGHTARRFEASDNQHSLVCAHEHGERRITFDRVLVALGRRANTEGLGLEALGIQADASGRLPADGRLRTSHPDVYVCGDVTGPYQFTHSAAHQAWYAAVNALFAPLVRFHVDYRVIPWATYTAPEVARVGLNEEQAQAQGIAHEVTRFDLDELDRAITEGEASGWVKVLTPPGSDRILGATIVGAHAGEMIAEFVLAMRHGLGLKKILATIHVYPTLNEANKYAAGEWRRRHAPEGLLRWLARFHAWRRG